jgi:hypothetical protein
LAKLFDRPRGKKEIKEKIMMPKYDRLTELCKILKKMIFYAKFKITKQYSTSQLELILRQYRR